MVVVTQARGGACTTNAPLRTVKTGPFYVSFTTVKIGGM